MQNLLSYANLPMCTHLLTYAKFAGNQKLGNSQLPQTKCIYANIAYDYYEQIPSCDQKAKFAREYLFNSAE